MATEPYEFDVEDVEYLRHGDKPLLARTFVPRGKGPFRTVIELHGGAWSQFDRLRGKSVHEALARSGVSVVTLDFRQAEEGRYPLSVADINYGVRWTKANAARLKSHPDAIGLSGNSTGGHLAMLVAMRPRDSRYGAIPLPAGSGDFDASVRAVVMLWPVINPLGRYHYAKKRLAEPNPPDWCARITQELLPEVARRKLATACDVFVEQNAFSVEDARPMLLRAKELGLSVRVHAEQLSHQGGARLAAELGARSAGHLEFVTADDARALADAGVVCEVLSLAQVFLRGQRPIPGRMLADAGCTLAVATDMNPGTAMSSDLLLAAGLSVTQSGLTVEEALKGITVHAAKALGLDDRGAVVEGKRADLAVFDARHPAELVYRWSDVAARTVIVNGRVVVSAP